MMETSKPSTSNTLASYRSPSRSGNEPRRTNPLAWWYRLTAPSEPPANASLAQREAVRRGRLSSTILLVMIVHVGIAIPVGIITGNVPLLTTLIVTLVIDGIALLFNRRGKRFVAGLLVVTALQLGFMLALLANPGGLAVSNLPTFDLMVEADLVAVAFFLDLTIFLVAAVNCFFIWACITLEPHTPELGHLIATDGYDVIVRPILLQIIVAVITYLWASSATRAIVRADRAEEIAELERREIERQQREIEGKQQLDMGIQQILQTHVQVANGNFSARAPLGKDNILWQIAYSLNNLLARLQGYNQVQVQLQRAQAENYRLHNALQNTLSAQHELQRTREAAARLVEVLKQSKSGRTAPLSQQSGTIIDSVAMQLINSADLSHEKRTFSSGQTSAEGI